jgi:hypothetical protein
LCCNEPAPQTAAVLTGKLRTEKWKPRDLWRARFGIIFLSSIFLSRSLQAALNMARLSLLKNKLAKFDLAKQEIVL